MGQEFIVRILSVCVCVVAMALIGCYPKSTQKQYDKRVRMLVSMIDDHPSQTHFDVTPATIELKKIGPTAIPSVLPLILSDDYFTRLRAINVLYGISAEMFGFVPGVGWPDSFVEEQHREFWRMLGSVSRDSSREECHASFDLWQKWLSSGGLQKFTKK